MLTAASFLTRASQSVAAIKTSAAPVLVFDTEDHPEHQTLSDGKAYGMWADGGCVPYKGADGETYFIVPCSENYRVRVDDWDDGEQWDVINLAYESPRNPQETYYSNRVWIFAPYAIGDVTFGLGHHEWYNQMETVDGIAGYNAHPLGNARQWVSAVLWMKSNSGNGASWSQYPFLDERRAILIPEPYAVQATDGLYGFRYISNIVKEGSYYYALVDMTNLTGVDELLDEGFILIRTTDMQDPESWEFWGGAGWTAVDRETYQGNQGQPIYQFFKNEDWDPYAGSPQTCRMAQTIRWHVPSRQWLVFGFKGGQAPFFSYVRTRSLANPKFEENGHTLVQMAPGDTGGNYVGAHYISVFDPEVATDQNFTNIGNNPICITGADHKKYLRNRLEISVV